jgi:uncharacterized protein
MPTALVTGASRGLGAVFAERLARDGFDLVLVARDRIGLEHTAAAVRGNGMRADVLVADLADPAARATVEHRLADASRPVDVLVNNAGVENGNGFIQADLRDLQAQIDTNITAVMSLTHAALPGMIARASGSVINVASFAGYLSSPGNTYASTKAWVLAFTDTMAASLPGTGVSMIALCPGRMRTGKHDAPKTPSPLWLQPAAVVDQCLRDLARGRSLCTPGVVYRTVVGTLEMPRRTLRGLARLAGRGRAQRRGRAAQTHVRSAAVRIAA